jgi:hypothetical protein
MPHWSTLTSTPANLLRRDDGTQNIWRATHNDDTRDAPLSDAPFPAIGEALFPWHARCTHPFQCPRQLWSWWVQETLRHFTSPFASWRTCKTRQLIQSINNLTTVARPIHLLRAPTCRRAAMRVYRKRAYMRNAQDEDGISDWANSRSDSVICYSNSVIF